MIGMVMADDHAAHGLVGDGLDGLQHGLRQCRRAERVEDQHAIVGDGESGIAGVALILGTGLTGFAAEVPDAIAHGLGMEGRRVRAFRRLRSGRATQSKQQYQDSRPATGIHALQISDVAGKEGHRTESRGRNAGTTHRIGQVAAIGRRTGGLQ